MKTHRLLPVLLLFAALIWIVCGDDKSSGPDIPLNLTGTWILHEATNNGVDMHPPEDTSIYRIDGTGEYRPTFGWGPYEFTFVAEGDMLVITRTAGQDAGLVDTMWYAVASDTLTITDYPDSVTTRIDRWRRQ